MNPLATLGIGLGNALGGALIGDIFQGATNQRQLEQNQKLLDMQSKANKDMYDYQLNKQKEFATDMSYKWQIEHTQQQRLAVTLGDTETAKQLRRNFTRLLISLQYVGCCIAISTVILT